MTRPVLPDWIAAGLVALAAMLVMASGLSNGFAYDDLQVIVGDPAIHSPSTALARAFAPYLGGQMLRPVPLLGFAAQWAVGGGSPLTFRIVSLLLYAIACALVLLLLRRAGAAPGPALAGGVLYAVHPVHSEVTANSVGQLELIAAIGVLGAVLYYLGARSKPNWRRRYSLGLATFCLVALHAKESAYVLPGLLVMAEILVVGDQQPWRECLRELREPALVVLAAVAGSLAFRSLLLGELSGGLPHDSLTGMGFGERASAFLMFVPEWFRLLFWPLRLQAEYGPPALDPHAAFGASHLLGIGLVLAAAALAVWTWHRAPLVALGVAWAATGLMPVANLLFPTGILVAERTLFLPSVGLALAAAGVAQLVAARMRMIPVLPHAVVLAAGIVALAAAGWRSVLRQPEWRDTYTVFERTVLVSPDTYRAHLLLGRQQRDRGNLAGAELSFRRAADLWERDPRPFEEWGQLLRARGDCASAVPILARGVEADSARDTARSRLIECLIVERRWDEAEREVERGLAQGVRGYQRALARVQAGRRADQPD